MGAANLARDTVMPAARQADSPRARRRVRIACTHVVARPSASERASSTVTPAGQQQQQLAHHLETRRAVPCGPHGLLAQEHVADYVRDGFLLVSGLIPPAVLDAAVDCMWDVMDRENRQSWRGPPLGPRAKPLDRASPSTWLGDWQGASSRYLCACVRCCQHPRR